MRRPDPEGSTMQPGRPSADPAPVARPLRALLVEDEALIALLIEEYLQDAGVADVVVAGTLSEGLEAARSGRFDCAILDVNLGDARSDAIADVLAERRVPFAFSTGYGSEGLAARHNHRPVVTKPAQTSAYQALIAELLEGGPRPSN
ncbi:response regulator [Roseivivax sp. CAU 1761]